MILKAFAVLDLKASAYVRPFFFSTAGQAIRAFIDTASDPQSMFGRHPEDFCLYEIGTFDDETAVLEACPPVNLGVVAAFLESESPQPVAPFDHPVEIERGNGRDTEELF